MNEFPVPHLIAPDCDGPWQVRDLPPEAPLAMPIQRLDAAPPAAPGTRAGPPLWGRRALLIGGSATVGLVASCGVALPIAVNGFDLIDQLFVLVSLALFAWLAFGLLNSIAGLACLLRTRRAGPARIADALRDRVAVLVPVYNEEVGPLETRLRRMRADLAAEGLAGQFEFFVLSDSGIAAEGAERAMCRRLRATDGPAIWYRRRLLNTERKPGNIADWVRRFGAAYPAMLVLDADSLMSGAAMRRLAATLEADPGLALVQTNPRLTDAQTVFARWQQYAVALYGPVASAGLAWWSGEEATFWGHNAILRTRAFASSCGLPALPGTEPIGGPILSHDMVEAVLLRRRGWRTRLLTLDEGSYEESPPTLIDHAIRDRRWCQGNLQHLALLDTAGLHWIGRLQLLLGASAYLTSPLWLLLLAGGLFQAIRSGTPVADLGTPGWLIALTLTLLFGNRVLAIAWALADEALVRRLGGWRVILRSLPVDVALSVLTAPATMASQCLAIAEIMAGRPSGWRPQRRRSDGIALGEALDGYRWHMLLGLVFWTVSLSELGGGIWSLPVALGLLGAPFIAAATSRADLGSALARAGIFADAVAEPVLGAGTPPAPRRGPWAAASDAAAA